MDLKSTYANVSQRVRSNPTPYILGAILVIVIITILSIIISIRRDMANASPYKVSGPNQALFTPTAFGESTLPATLTPVPSPTPIPSNLWTVKAILGKETHYGFNSLVVEFENTTSKEIKKGHCQSPRDPAPKLGATFILEDKGGFSLFTPYDTAKQAIDLESKVQRFRLIE